VITGRSWRRIGFTRAPSTQRQRAGDDQVAKALDVRLSRVVSKVEREERYVRGTTDNGVF
jgi:hypothetical protein